MALTSNWIARLRPSQRALVDNRDGIALLVLWAIGVSLWQPLSALSELWSLGAFQHTSAFDAIDHSRRFINVATPLALGVAAAHVYRCARRLCYTSPIAQRTARVWLFLLALTLLGHVDTADVITIALVLGALAPLIKGRVTQKKAIKSGLWLFAALVFFGPGALVMWAIPLIGSMLWRASQLKTTDYRALFGATGAALGGFVLLSPLL
ncbi:hypothetical protein [Larsenimonas salina]|uniref:hypothetical protein n=1 Tax=Larsenimonas salina TaxID=1295565 RepID=UPI00207484E8|nr:hypothetical protein [Larsenimonas salina]MCM5704416.1 hypothetical protein [Larsenimonas salina]